jgi:hypothetical protein
MMIEIYNMKGREIIMKRALKQKKLNKLALISLLGLMGILGLVTENKGFLGFFGYLYYLRYFTVIPDELFKDNVRKSGSFGFFTGMAVSAVTISYFVLSGNIVTAYIGFASGFVASMLAFTISLSYFEFKEQSGL